MQTVPTKVKGTTNDKGIQNNTLERSNQNKPLTEEQKRHNKFASEVCYVVERAFVVLKKTMVWRKPNS